MVKAVIFDCFGVLATEAWLPFKAKYFGGDPKLFQRASDINHQANRGLISREAATKATAELAGISVAEFRRAIGSNVPDEALFAYIRELKPHYKIGFLSNISENYLQKIFAPAHLTLFDAVTLSFESGFIKPQLEVFELAAKQLEVELEECVMVDNQERNVNGARQAGMRAILYKDVRQLKAELEPLLKA